MADASTPALAARTGAPRHLRRTLRIAAWLVAVSVAIAFLFANDFWSSFTFSMAIGACSWLFIDAGRALAASWRNRDLPPSERSGWPGWVWMTGILVVGTVLGYSLGIALGNFVLGADAESPFSTLAIAPRKALGMIAFGLVPGFAVTYFFYSRSRIAQTEARAQAAQREAAENQLRLLQSQLEPHMLFNTLANLRVLIATDPPRAQAMLDQLIAFLRATLAASRSGSHSLADEFARLADYLALMKVRLGERLRYDFDLPPELAGAAVPPLLLQPIVENSIKHAIEPSVEGGSIRVSAAREGAQLVLRVSDTGAGPGEAMQDGARFGLEQVRSRLAALHGAAASLALDAAGPIGAGTIATLRMPLDSGTRSTTQDHNTTAAA